MNAKQLRAKNARNRQRFGRKEVHYSAAELKKLLEKKEKEQKLAKSQKGDD